MCMEDLTGRFSAVGEDVLMDQSLTDIFEEKFSLQIVFILTDVIESKLFL